MLTITTSMRALPPRILIYGPGGIGKTTLAASIPGGALMPIEDGADAIDCAKLPRPETWDQVIEMIDELAVDQQGLKALTIDSVTALQDMCFAAVCSDGHEKSIEGFGYGKGYVLAAEKWKELLEHLNVLRQKMVIVLIGHAAVSRHEDPRLPGYDRLTPRLQQNGKGGGIMPITVEWCDVVACAAYQVLTDAESVGVNKQRTRAMGDGERTLYCQERPAYLAKNRYRLPAELPFAWAPLVDGIRAAFAKPIPIPSTDAAATATAV